MCQGEQEHQACQEKEVILGKMEKLDFLDFQVSQAFLELGVLMDHKGIQAILEHLERKDPQEGVQRVPEESLAFQA